MESENAFMNIAVTDASKNNSKNDNCKLLLDEEPPKKMEDFFGNISHLSNIPF